MEHQHTSSTVSNAAGHISSEQYAVWHARLLAGDVAVYNEVSAALLPPLCCRLARRHRWADEAAVHTAAEDALIEYFDSPSAYDPARLPLDAFLSVIAHRRLLNHGRAVNRRLAHELAVGDALPDRPAELEPRPSRWRDLRLVLRCCKTKRERAFLRARLTGQCRTEVLASILSADQLPPEAQRAEIHRVMERLRFRVRSVRRRIRQESPKDH